MFSKNFVLCYYSYVCLLHSFKFVLRFSEALTKLKLSSAFGKLFSMWSVGLDYLKQCGVDGRCRLELLIPSIILDNEIEAFKLVSVCKACDLPHLIGDVERFLAMRFSF